MIQLLLLPPKINELLQEDSIQQHTTNRIISSFSECLQLPDEPATSSKEDSKKIMSDYLLLSYDELPFVKSETKQIMHDYLLSTDETHSISTISCGERVFDKCICLLL